MSDNIQTRIRTTRLNALLSSVCIGVYCVPVAVQADVWKYWGDVSVEVGDNDNVRLRPSDNPIGDAANTLNSDLNLYATRFSDKFDLELKAGGDYQNFFEADNEERLITGFHPRASIGGKYRIDERQTFNASVAYREEQVNDAVASTELDETDIGFSADIIERKLMMGGAEFERSETEKLDWSAGVGYTKREYDQVNSLSDSDQYSFDIETAYELSEKNKIVSDWSYLDFSSDISDVKRYTAMVGVAHKWSEVTNVRATIGYTYQDGDNLVQVGSNQFQVQSTSKGDFEAKVVVNHRGERSRLNFTAAHTQKPSISGRFIQSDRLSFTAGYGFSERVAGELTMRYFDNSSDEARPSDDNRKYFSVSPKISWLFNERVSVFARYEYQDKDRVDLNQRGSSNAIYIGIRFESLKEI